MASNARVFTGCRALFAAAKTATPKSTATATAAITTTFAKKKSGFMYVMSKKCPISPALADFLGVDQAARTDAVKKIWEHIKSKELQDPTNKKVIICDDKLKTIFDGKDTVGFLEISKMLAPHFAKLGFQAVGPISPALADFLGVDESARTDAVKKIWEYIKSNELQDPMNKKVIICDNKLKKIFDGKDTVGFLEITKMLAPHFVKTA